METKELPRLHRGGAIVAVRMEEAEDGDRRIRLSFSSEERVRQWWGTEILGHKRGEVRLERLGSGRAPLLVDHRNSVEAQIGVIESAQLSGRRGEAVARFGKSELADRILARVRDGELSSISVGYRIHKLRVEEETEEGAVYRATDWEPYEISIVASPADTTVGVGRAAAEAGETFKVEIERRSAMADKETKETDGAPKGAEATRAAAPAPAPEAEAKPTGPSPEEARNAERVRVREIAAIGRKCGMDAKVVDKAIEDGTPLSDFQRAALDHMSSAEAGAVRSRGGDIGMVEKEVERFSFVRLLRSQADPHDADLRDAAKFELDACRAAADKGPGGKRRKGRAGVGLVIPHEVLRAPLPGMMGQPGLTVGDRKFDPERMALRASDQVVGTPAAGGNVVDTVLMSGSVIDVLRVRPILSRLGIRIFEGLEGNVAFPRQLTDASTYWVAEDGSPSQSGITFDQVPMSPKTLAAETQISRRMLIQSSIDIEVYVRQSIAFAMAREIDRCALNGSADADAPDGLLDAAIAGGSAVNVVDVAAAGQPTYGDCLACWSSIASDDADASTMGFATTPPIVAHLMGTPKFAGGDRPIMETMDRLIGFRSEWSNQVAANDLWFGDWSQLYLGSWGGLGMMVDPYSLSSTGAIKVNAFQDVDIAIAHEEAFCRAYEATP